jgi:ubiquinone/menaquinone biosynthesis C-methylase UbiE
MRRLSGAREELDGDDLDPAALRGNLGDLARVNRWLGGVALSRAAIGDLVERRQGDGRSPLRLLDVGTGAADVPLELLASWRGPRSLEILAVDRSVDVVAAAIARNPALARAAGIEVRVADGLALPLEDGSVDIAHASLLLHHLDPLDAGRLIRELSRVARLGVVLNDLSRSRLGLVGAWLMGHLLTRNAFTRNDAPLSVRRAYTASEARAMVEAQGLVVVSLRFGLLRHRWAIAAARA